jgi:5-methylthioadenosine/S-adenosylhomocysteine deaminase
MSDLIHDSVGPAADDYIRLHGGAVLTCDEDGTVYDPGEIWLSGGEIAAVGPVGQVRPPAGAARVEIIDTSGRIVLPGLINAHAHSYAALLKGSVDIQPLDIYMLHVIAAGAGRSARDVYISALVDAITMLHTGTTAVVDHFSHRPAMTFEAIEAVLRAYGEIGIRAAVAPMFADLPYRDTVPLGSERQRAPMSAVRPDPAQYFVVLEQALDYVAKSADGRLQVLLGVDGPQRCSPELLDLTAHFQKRHGLGLHTHMLETKTQAVMAPKTGFIRQMCELGILNAKSSLVHFIWCSDADIAAAMEAGVTLVHVPTSNLHIGSGIFPLLRLTGKGLAIAVGTDGANCGPVNMFEKLRVANLLSRVTEPDFERWLSAEQLLVNAQRGGARALAKAGQLGVVRPGALADLMVIDLDHHWHRPMGDVWNHLLYYENGSGVEHVFVAGRPVLRDGVLTTIDEAAVLNEAEEIVSRHRSRSSQAHKEIAKQYPYYRDMIKRTLADTGDVDRFARLR